MNGKVFDIEKARIKDKLSQVGIKWHEDQQGKVRLWLRKETSKKMGKVIAMDFEGKQ